MTDEASNPTPKWTQLEAIERRVLGVLVEKAKTTPDAYPLTLKGLVTGSKQKSNRFPQMDVDDNRVEEALDQLRSVGAVSIIQGDGRIEKYRHLAYDWLGVDKVELAIMAELLLRGAQTVGELRSRAARMEPIKGMAELGPLLESLLAKSLVVYVTPPGRGAVITHNLYQPRELEKIRREHGVATPADTPASAPEAAQPPPVQARASTPPAPSTPEPAASPESATAAEVEKLRQELADLRGTLTEFREQAEASINELQQQLAALNHQLGN